VSTIIIGNIAEGQVYWGEVEFLKQQLVATYAKTNPFMAVWKPLSSRVTVFLQLVDGFPRAFIYTSGGGTYMDSGIIEYYTFLGYSGSYKPGILHHTISTAADDALTTRLNGVIAIDKGSVSSVTPEYLGRGPTSPLEAGITGLFSSGAIEGESTCSVGNKYANRQDHSLDLGQINGHPEITTSFTGDSKEFNSSDYRVKKFLMEYFPGSTLTGKAKLYLQALYGSMRNDLGLYTVSVLGVDIPAGLYLPITKAMQDNSLLRPYVRPYDVGYNVMFVPKSTSYAILKCPLGE